jgi:TIR domain-containing protein
MYFLSYASEDKQAAQALALGLEAAGLALWTDLLPGHLPLGQPFPGQLEEGIRQSTGYLVLIGQRGIDGSRSRFEPGLRCTR